MTALYEPEERLLILLSYVRLESAEEDELQFLLERGIDWNELWELADHNAAVPLVYENLCRLGFFEQVTPEVQAQFVERTEEIREANERRLQVARDLFRRFQARNIPVVVLKGVLFAEQVYRNPAYKKMNDVDILIRKEDLGAIFEIYAEMDLFSAAELLGKSPRKQEKFSHHLPPFFSKDMACMIGTHWGLITPLAPYTIDYDAIWSRVVDIDFHGVRVQAMAPIDNLHHLCVHLPYYKTGIRELADIYNLIRHFERELNLELLLEEVGKAKSENLVYHALSLANRLCPRTDVEEVIRRLRPKASWYFRRDTERKIERIGRLLRSRSVHMSRIEKAYASFTATKDPTEKWQALSMFWKNLLAAPDEDVIRFNALDDPSSLQLLLGRVATPWRISRVFARDLGAGVYLAVLAKLHLDLVKQTATHALWPPTETANYETYARKLGVSVDALEKLKEGLE